jgi:hypothetical protein
MTRLRALCGDAVTIVVTSVYDPSDGTSEIAGSGLPRWPAGPELVQELNTTLADLAARHGGLLADVHGRFRGHGVSAGDVATAEARPADRDLWFCGVIEPNAWGRPPDPRRLVEGPHQRWLGSATLTPAAVQERLRAASDERPGNLERCPAAWTGRRAEHVEQLVGD